MIPDRNTDVSSDSNAELVGEVKRGWLFSKVGVIFSLELLRKLSSSDPI